VDWYQNIKVALHQVHFRMYSVYILKGGRQFMKNNSNQLIKRFVASLLVTITIGAIVEPAAMAVISDPVAMSTLQQRKRDLLVRETNLLRSRDDLQKQIDDLKRINDGSSQRQLNDLCQSLDKTFSDLQKTQFDIRDVSTRMM